ncbi:unnamed protein product (macronuclear) [Paramecium tetraurelia]|uniref:Uncharacterized protein n=1 Tax=Paramecium tetraurelia TaxID=5888 RepID=A0BH76_PARTE|nr:uncharacterized protein GSPATT00028928001 [Paramecium tetraurelia]CAK57893.1 unnamed protein product [Paramecium tetraurelia]|eukprot:XP_001425291.1 hypothetical protein (macronuclear) [Paramecium tetraurelia strain d4-2]
MHRPKPHIRVQQEKDILDGFSRLQQVQPLIQINPTVDKVPNMKKIRLLEDRYTQIEKDNRLLLEKITNIMKSETSRVRRPKRVSSFECRKKSEQQQIRRENQILLSKISNKKSYYSKNHFDKEWNKTKQYFINLGGLRSLSQKQKEFNQSFFY